MDLPPPPPPPFHHNHHHHHLRYVNVLHPPDFNPQPYPHHLPPPPPPPPPHHRLRSHILLPPPPPPPPPPRRFDFHPILDRSRPYEIDSPPKPYLRRNFLPPPPPPPRDGARSRRLVRDYPERNPRLEDESEAFCGDYIQRELAEIRVRDLRYGAWSRETYDVRDDESGRLDNGIDDCGSEMCSKRDHGEMRWDSGLNDRGRERDYYGEKRWNSGVSDWVRGLYMKTDNDERRRDSRMSGRGRELYREGGDDEKRRSYGNRLEYSRSELMEIDSSLGRFSGRLGSGVDEGESIRSKKKRKLQKETGTDGFQPRGDGSRLGAGYEGQQLTEESSGSSIRGREKIKFQWLRTKKNVKRKKEAILDLAISFKSNALVAKAILSPSCPAVKKEINAMDAENRLMSSVSDSSTVKSSKDVVKSDLLPRGLDFESDSLDTSKELVDKAVVSGSGSVAANDANDLKEIAVSNQPQKDMNLPGPTVVGSGRARRRRLRKKKRARNQLLPETSLQMEKDSGRIINAKDCISPSASSQLSSDTTLSKGNLSSAFIGVVPEGVLLPTCGGIVPEKGDNNVDFAEPFVPNLKRKRSSLATLSVSPYVADAGINANRLVTTLEDGEVELDAPGTFLANESSCHGDSLGFSSHGNNVDKFLQNEEIKVESIDQYTRLGADRVDDISKRPFQDGFPSLENSFVNGPSNYVVSPEGNEIAGLSQEDKCFSEIQASNASSECDSALKPENVIISNVGSADANSKEVSMNKVDIPQVVDSEEVSSSEGVTISDYSNASFGISTSTDAWSKKRSIDDIGSGEGSLEALSNGKSCLSIDYSSNITRKRKDRAAQRGSCVTNVVFGTVRSIDGELGRPLTKDLVPAMETDFLGEKDGFKEDDKSNGGTSGVEDSTLGLDFDANGSVLCDGKKRKVSSPRSNLSSLLEDEMVADGLNGDHSKHYQGSTGLAEWEYERREDSGFSRNTESSACQSENELICGGENISNRKLDPTDLNLLPSGKSLEKAASDISQTTAYLSRSLPETNCGVVKKLNIVHGKQTLCKNQLISASPKVYPGHNPLYFSNYGKLHTTHVTKSRTWHRNGNSLVAAAERKLQPSPVPQSHGTKIAQPIQSSYIRNGNSLVRNPSPSSVTSGFHKSGSSVYRRIPSTDNLKNNLASDSKTGNACAQSTLTTEQVYTSETPCETMDASEGCINSPAVSEGQGDSGNSSNSPSTLGEWNSSHKITYVKRRSNQLVAASNSDDMSVLGVDKSLVSSSDGYYKSKKNQLVRASSENHAKRPDANGTAHRRAPPTVLPKPCTRRQSGFGKGYRSSKLSFVWKLHDMQSSEKRKTSVGSHKGLPNLFSWKRTTHWRSVMHALVTKPNKSSFSIASQSLLLSRKRGAIYTRSSHGYSLRMSKIVSVGGSSLKWSKSIERNSKKADEEATRAVAAAEKRKSEENGAVPISSKSRNNVSRKLVLSVKLRPGERIFRFGSERYKMDPTRRTLHRITAENESSSVVLQTEKTMKRAYVPRRLLIGNEEYVRIGNGNQLVRDPKKRTRVLASEKVRWSLRTARLRLARKRKYCQFFTRFGKCNKDDGKCPYIHDPSKMAVCTKFLNGSCTNLVCKLTHKVIPERMEDCSYFLKGSCSNENCPYRHVNVNPNAAVCKSFLRGYCADGNECRKKHTYVCPAFEATGVCHKSSTCKLHHPKKKIDKKPTSEQKIVRGRYFDGGLIGDADFSETSTQKVSAKGKDDVVFHGKFPDYISLDVSDEEVGQT